LLWISYEELLSEPKKSIDHIAEFIGLEPTVELTKGVLTASNFQAMKQTFDEEDAKKIASKRIISAKGKAGVGQILLQKPRMS